MVCLYVAALLVKQVLGILLSAIGTAAAFVLHCAGERSVGLSLLVLLAAMGLALVLPSPSRTILRAMSWAGEGTAYAKGIRAKGMRAK